MRYSASLAKEEREKIFSLFLTNQRLKFSDIEKALNETKKIRSNMVAYHISEMQKENILSKHGEFYELTESAEKYLPVFSHISGREQSPLPVVLVAIMRKGKVLLLKRKTRPYRNYWSMVGGKMKLHESFDDAAIRLAKEKCGIECSFASVNAVLHEKVHGEDVKHSFILFFVQLRALENSNQAKTQKGEEMGWFSPKMIPEQTIPSDFWLIKKKLKSRIAIFSADMNDAEGKLEGFSIKKLGRKKE